MSIKDYGKFTENIAEEHSNFLKRENIRTDTDLIAMIEEFGSEKCSSKYSRLIIKDVPSGSHYRIYEYDGYEGIEYRDEINWSVAT